MKLRMAALALVLLSTTTALGRHKSRGDDHRSQNQTQSQSRDYGQIGHVQDDRALIEAIDGRRQVYYVEAADLEVTRILPDDRNGSPHQLWQARTSSGDIVTIVYNSDMGDRVPVEIGARFSVGGQFLWVNRAGMIHWTHEDPRGSRPDGYVYMNGTYYGNPEIH